MKRRLTIILVALCMITSIYCIAVAAQRYTETTSEYEAWLQTREVITITVLPGDSIDGYWVEFAPDWTLAPYMQETPSSSMFRIKGLPIWVALF